ncbi:hypothetical protein ABZ770_17665 [Streptomyces sp. NPDC006654]|uniref:hypothetical protein n=1 Tax=Streptomyces sp. NPDC006654 TaxID=3156897 RepID=UPI003404D1EB
MEIIDSRVADRHVSQADTVADNASSTRVAVGRPVDATDDLLTGLRDECVGLSADGERVAFGLGAEVLGDPLRPWPGRPGRSTRTAALSTRASCCFTGSVHAGVPLTPGSRLAVRSGTGRLPGLTVTVR